MKRFNILLAALAALAVSSWPAFGHHSFAVFDLTKTVSITGVVKEVQWTNPHVWVYLDVPRAEGGAPVRWGIEFTSVNHLTRLGMTRNSLKAGDTLEFTVNPYADGTPGGRFQHVKMSDGAYLCDVSAQQFCAQNNKK